MLTLEEVKKIAFLARIELSEAEVEKFQKDLSRVLEYVEELKTVFGSWEYLLLRKCRHTLRSAGGLVGFFMAMGNHPLY
jgi:hypothetical protein